MITMQRTLTVKAIYKGAPHDLIAGYRRGVFVLTAFNFSFEIEIKKYLRQATPVFENDLEIKEELKKFYGLRKG